MGKSHIWQPHTIEAPPEPPRDPGFHEFASAWFEAIRGELDREARSNVKIARRALLATLTFAGLRISELLDLEWRDVDLAAGRLRVRHSKTDAGSRYVDLLPVLRDELSAHKATSTNAAPNAYVFPSAASTRQDGGRVACFGHPDVLLVWIMHAL